MFFTNFIAGYKELLHHVAELTVITLEFIGILIIVIGSVKALIQVLSKLKNKETPNVMIALGRALALALEFKMGAEIVNTVIIRDLRELAVLAIVIALRAILAALIHWEIKNEKKEEEGEKSKGVTETNEKE